MDLCATGNYVQFCFWTNAYLIAKGAGFHLSSDLVMSLVSLLHFRDVFSVEFCVSENDVVIYSC